MDHGVTLALTKGALAQRGPDRVIPELSARITEVDVFAIEMKESRAHSRIAPSRHPFDLRARTVGVAGTVRIWRDRRSESVRLQ